MNKEEFNKLYQTLKKSKFRQQKFPGWRPLPTISCITIIFITFGVIFVIVGILILIFSSHVTEFKFRYDLICNKTLNCQIPITIPEKLKKPIMIYYQINDLRQNHRFYMENKSDKQLKGEDVSKEDLEKNNVCENNLYNEALGNDGGISYPCGLIANSFYRQNFTFEAGGKELNVTTEGIAYKSDRDYYKLIASKNYWQDVTDEHFMIWMRISPFESPRKLWGIIENDDLVSGTLLKVKIDYNMYGNFEKYLILSTRNVFGGKNKVLGSFYIVFGAICFISAVVFINIFNFFHKKPKK